MHKKGVFHRDIKPQNILFNSETECAKIADLGCMYKTDVTKYGHGTPAFSNYQSFIKAKAAIPEDVKELYDVPKTHETLTSSKLADFFAIGQTLYYLITRKLLHDYDATPKGPAAVKVFFKKLGDKEFIKSQT